MRFSFSDDQLALRDATRDLLEHECTPAHVRAAWTNDTGRVPGLWAQLVEMGVVGLLAPESAGGLGLTFVDLVLVLEETGRHAVPEPIVEQAPPVVTEDQVNDKTAGKCAQALRTELEYKLLDRQGKGE